MLGFLATTARLSCCDVARVKVSTVSVALIILVSSLGTLSLALPLKIFSTDVLLRAADMLHS